MEDTSFNPIRFFQEQINHPRIENRLQSARHLKYVLQVSGIANLPELITFLCSLSEPEDELMLALADQLDQIAKIIKDDDNSLNLILTLLERYMNVDETVVRERATDAAVSAIKNLTIIPDQILDMLRKLCANELFSSKVSACSLFPVIYAGLQDPIIKNELCELFSKLCHDEAPMVRRSAAKKLGEFVEVVEIEIVLNQCIALLRSLFDDDQVTVKLLTIESFAKMGVVLKKQLGEQEVQTHIVPIIHQAAEDPSWRVRLAVAQNFVTFCEAAGEQMTNSEFIPILLHFLQDGEIQVRIVCIKAIPRLSQLIKTENFIAQIIPILHVLSEDIMPNIRSTVATACVETCVFVDSSVIEQFIPIFRQSLEDDPSISEGGYSWEHANVKLSILKNLSNVSSILPKISNDLVSLFARLVRDENWRVRKAVVETLPLFPQNQFHEQFTNEYFAFFEDKINEVRIAAAQVIPKLSERCGHEWLRNTFLPRISHLYHNTKSYLQRVTVLQAFKVLAKDPTTQDVLQDIFPLIFQATQDRVPNVRFVAVQVLPELFKATFDEELKSRIKQQLDTIAQDDNDADVKKYAKICFDSCI